MSVAKFRIIVSKLVYIVTFMQTTYVWSFRLMTSSCVTWYRLKGLLFEAVYLQNHKFDWVETLHVDRQWYWQRKSKETTWWRNSFFFYKYLKFWPIITGIYWPAVKPRDTRTHTTLSKPQGSKSTKHACGLISLQGTPMRCGWLFRSIDHITTSVHGACV